MSDTTLNILETDESLNIKLVVSTITAFSMTQRIGMWGEDMFAHTSILGAGFYNTYTTEGKNIKSVDEGLYIKKA